MINFSYSSDALNTINRFYKKDFMIYVEGNDDVLFWDYLFRNNKQGKTYMIESVGGCDTLNDYIEKILNNNTKIIVALDLDHNVFINKKYNHNRIIYTYGYSIENTIYCPFNLNKIISHMSRKRIDITTHITKWIDIFSEKSFKLLLYDITNRLYLKSIEVFGDNCCRFLKSPRSHELNEKTINDFLLSISHSFTENEINSVKDLIDRDKRALRYLIKGHFFTHAVINYIKKRVKENANIEITLNLDSLYSNIIDGCSNCRIYKNCDDYNYLNERIGLAIESLLN